MLSGATAPDNTATGYIVGEQITFTAYPAGSSYSWALARPSGATERSSLSDATSASVTLTPDIEGFYTLTCIVDGTTYVLRLAAVSVGVVSTLGALRLNPLLPEQVPTPSAGMTIFYSSQHSTLTAKDSAGNLLTLDMTAV